MKKAPPKPPKPDFKRVNEYLKNRPRNTARPVNPKKK